MRLFSVLSRCVILRHSRLEFSSQVSLKRFYRSVWVAKGVCTADGVTETGYEVFLDKSRLRTPGGNIFSVPHEGLALAVANEWDSQQEYIERFTLPLTTICSHVIDNPTERSKEVIVNGIMEYADTDTICYRIETPEELLVEQESQWGTVLDFIENRYRFRPPVTTGFCLTPVPKECRDFIRRHLLSINRWGLVGLQTCVENLKSLWLTLAMVDGFLTSQRAVELSRLEQNFQERRWGSVEWFHEVDEVEVNTRVSAGLLVVLTSHARRTVKKKSVKGVAVTN
ncbi:ATP synthase mitochondrial F1 complex assembly factor 2 [Echinococcus granulosus]|uniref:ATP synthase mitochondrial F1 complex assembly n=1 Tax=Echinococcus granulosus TaxID=6210 RepID=A0A068WSL8_ECHGR|nr:ATP synthase mitochondrial F1 complex assembly factor 2 [Echinococcus granulosus]CDS21472.1 ATP synthase mitochondrial F1 complex assembly [Echinococcus granulosus]